MEVYCKKIDTGTTYIFKSSLKMETKDLCYSFSYQCTTSTTKDLYRSRKMNSLAKIINDHYFGKLAEFGVCNFLHQQGILYSNPDLQILQANRKSYGADLSITGNTIWKIHVKCQPLASQIDFGFAWLFQENDKLTYFPNDNDLIAFTSINSKEEIVILKIVRAYELKGCFDYSVRNKKRVTLNSIAHVTDFLRF